MDGGSVSDSYFGEHRSIGWFIVWLIFTIGALGGGTTLLVLHTKSKKLKTDIAAEEAAAKAEEDAAKAAEETAKREGYTPVSCFKNPWSVRCKLDKSYQTKTPTNNRPAAPEIPSPYVENKGYLWGGIILTIVGSISFLIGVPGYISDYAEWHYNKNHPNKIRY